MTGTPLPSFERWRDYCFTAGCADFSAYAADPAARARADSFSIPAPALAGFLCTLFEHAAALRGRFTPDQLGDGTWYVFGLASESFGAIQCAEDVPENLHLRVYHAVPRMYTDLYDHLCNQARGTQEDRSDADRLDTAVYMIWDMDGIECPLYWKDAPAALTDAALDTLEAVLDRCVTGSCLKSALHGLGEVQPYHTARVQKIIDGFMRRRSADLPPWLREYAAEAREGNVL